MSQNNSQGEGADPAAQMTDQQLNDVANEVQLNGNTSDSQLRDEGASISQTMPLIPHATNEHYQENSLAPGSNAVGQNGKKEKVVLPPISGGPNMNSKSIPHSDRQGQTLVPNEEQHRTFDPSERGGRTSISAHDVTKTHQIDQLDDDPIAAQQRIDDLNAEKTLKTVVGMFGNQDHNALKKAKLDAKKKEAQKDILGLPRQEKDGYAFSFRVNGQKKFAVYDKASCGCCKAEFFLRQKIVYIFCHPWFDNFIILMIFINSMALACYNYDDRDNDTQFNKELEKLGLLFSIVFTIEAFIKIVAMGFVMHKNSYLRDYWNWLDFLVVCIGFVELFPIIPAADLKSLRTLRVLRPLKSINAFPSMRRLIGSLLASLPSLANAVVFMLFIFLLFGILGVQQFKGVFYQRCRLTPYPINDTETGLATHWPIDYDVERLCTIDGAGAYTCPKNKEPGNEGLQFCGSIRPDWPTIPFETEGTINQELIMYGIIHFDDLISGIIAIFQMITLEGWTTIMYNIGDATQTWMAITFCILLVIVGSFFLLNVVLAVIMDAFDDVDKNHVIEVERQAKETQALKELYEIVDTSEEEKIDPRNAEELLIIDQDPLNGDFPPSSLKIDNQIQPLEHEESKVSQEENQKKSKKKRHSKDEPMPERARENAFYKFFYLVCTHDAFTVTLTSCIVINTVLLALDRFPISKQDTNQLEFYNNILSWIFIIEMFIKMIGLGLKDYVADSFNIFDCSVVMISIVEQIIGWVGVNMGSGGAISALRAIRLLRVFKLARSWTSFRELLQKMIITLKDIRNFSVLMLIFMFIFTLLGMEMYAYKVIYVDDDLSAVASQEEKDKKIGSYPRANFNHPWNGIITVFIVLIGEDWNSSLYDHFRSEGYVAHVYFITLFILGNLILLNLFLAILLKNFEEPPGKDEEEEADDGKPKIPITQKIKMILCFCCKKREAANQVNIADAESPGRGSNNNRVEIELKGNTSRSGQALDDSNVQKMEKGQGVRNSTQANVRSDDIKDLSGNQSPIGRGERQISEPKDVKIGEQNPGQSSRKKSMWMSETDSPNKNRKKEMKKQNQALNLANGQDSKQGSMVEIKKQAALQSQKKTKKIIKLEGRALGLFSVDSTFRITCKNLVQHQNFDNVILFLIAFSTILLTLETPDMNPNGKLAYVLKNIDYVVSAVFLMELIIKNIVYGYIINGPGSYMRDAWNILDFIIVCISIISIVLQDVDLGILKVLRMARVLRPLRVISRNPGLRIAVMSLINAIPNIGNVMVVSILFLLLFAILGTNLYKGYFFYCEMENVPEDFQEKIIDKFDCMDYGGDWVNKDQNFDNVGASFITLFNVMTTEGWIGVMWDAVDANVINEMPKQGKSPSQAMFFILFMIFGSLFILNMFVGIVINVFNNEKEALQMNHYLTPTQDDWCECMILCYKTQPQSEFQPTGNKFKDYSHAVASHKLFESGIFMCILINTICLALTWYDEPPQVAAIISPINLAFNIIYTIEAIIKLIAFGKNYFNDGWNKFDLTIVIVAWIGMILNNVGLNIGASTTVIRSFRISRVFKIIRKYKNLRILFNTFIDAFPQLTNVGALLFLIIFVYSVLGMQIFGKVKLQDALTVHANFQSFTTALITLFRMATGESWHEIMFDCGRQKSITFDCYESITYEQIAAEGILGCGSIMAANMYFISFMVIVSFVFLQLFIAIILESFNTSSDEEGLKVKQETLDKFNYLWTKMFPDGDLYMDVTLLPQLVDQLLEEEIKQIYDVNLEVQDGDIDIYEYQKTIFLFNLHKDDDLTELASYKKDKIWKQKEEEKGVEFDESVPTIESASMSEDGGNSQFLQKMNKRSVAENAKIREKKLHKKQLNAFIAELEIPCYFISPKKSKKETLHYYYYDVLEGLARNLFLNLLLESREELVEKEAMEQENAEDQEPGSPSSSKGFTLNNISPIKVDEENKKEDEEWQFDPEAVEKEYVDGIKRGDISSILQSLENKGKNHDIQKLKEMQTLRLQRNKNVLDKLANSAANDSVIDSSQIASAMILLRAMKKYKAKIVAKRKLQAQQKSANPPKKVPKKTENVNIGFQQQTNDDVTATMMKTSNNMGQIRETDEDLDYENQRRVKKNTSSGVANKQLIAEDGVLRNSPSVDQVKRSGNIDNVEDCVPGNKQGEEVVQVKSSVVAAEERKEYVDFNNVSNNAGQRPKKKKRNIVSTASNPQHSLSQQSSEREQPPREYNFQAAEQLDIDPNEQADKESLKNIVSPTSQAEHENEFNQTTDVQDNSMFQKIDKQDRMNNTQQNFKFQKEQEGEHLQDVEEDGQD